MFRKGGALDDLEFRTLTQNTERLGGTSVTNAGRKVYEEPFGLSRQLFEAMKLRILQCKRSEACYCSLGLSQELDLMIIVGPF